MIISKKVTSGGGFGISDTGTKFFVNIDLILVNHLKKILKLILKTYQR